MTLTQILAIVIFALGIAFAVRSFWVGLRNKPHDNPDNFPPTSG